MEAEIQEDAAVVIAGSPAPRCFILPVMVNVKPGEGDSREARASQLLSGPPWMASALQSLWRCSQAGGVRCLGCKEAVLPPGTGHGAAQGRWGINHLLDVPWSPNSGLPLLDWSLRAAVVVPSSAGAQRGGKSRVLSRASPAFQAGKILGGSPERCSGSAMQKPMVASGKGTVPAPPSPAGRRWWSPRHLLARAESLCEGSPSLC